MSLFRWLFPASSAKRQPAAAESSGLSRMEATRPAAAPRKGKADAPLPGQPANRKSERMARRELLYAVVREAMVRSGVLSGSYKFKVLSLDARGRQFLIMMDLAREFGSETGRLAEIEALIAQGAKARHDIVVTAVYWRMNEHVAVGRPERRMPSPRRALSDSAPMPLEPLPAASQPAPLAAAVPAPAPQPAAAVAAPTRTQPLPRYEPLQADEVAAFKRALAQGVSGAAAPTTAPAAVKPAAVPAALKPAAVPASQPAGASAKAFVDGSGKHGPQSYTLLTGYEDTELPDAEARVPGLSQTQYGELT